MNIPLPLLLELYEHTVNEATDYRDPIGKSIWNRIKELNGWEFQWYIDDTRGLSIAEQNATELSRHLDLRVTADGNRGTVTFNEEKLMAIPIHKLVGEAK